MNYPEIRFQNPQLLLGSIGPDIQLAYKQDNRLHELSIDWLEQKLEDYEQAWRPHEQRVLSELCSILQLEFYQNVIDVYVAPFRSSFSDPMCLAAKLTPERAVEVLTHEITHRLLSDNMLRSDDGARHSKWRELFGTSHAKVTLVHIPVHATLCALYIDRLDEPNKVTADRQRSQKWEDYAASWRYVDEVGYEKIIDMIKESYTSI